MWGSEFQNVQVGVKAEEIVKINQALELSDRLFDMARKRFEVATENERRAISDFEKKIGLLKNIQRKLRDGVKVDRQEAVRRYSELNAAFKNLIALAPEVYLQRLSSTQATRDEEVKLPPAPEDV
ncbi:MAG: hypothetical protein GYA55_13390 [SAR324 cluster bacterium]|uniref:LemA family protein n=1 Tax=SAR324 cluster bacterium TaxID=2024889 RepID=A0A7X9ILE4_9DELT|nr:hypothetical protein [SAR324 cluster bacterium]